MTLEEPRAREKAKEEPIEDDDLYFLQSTFVYFQVCFLIDNKNADKCVLIFISGRKTDFSCPSLPLRG